MLVGKVTYRTFREPRLSWGRPCCPPRERSKCERASIWTLSLEPDAIGRRSVCPRCQTIAVIDDINEGRVVLRHDAETWHVLSKAEAASINRDRCLK